MHLGFFGHYKAGSHLHALGPQHKRSRNPSAVGNSSCRHDRDLHRVRHLGNQCHGRTLSDVAAGFHAFRHHRVRAAALHPPCQSYGSHNRDHLDSGFFPHAHILFRGSRAGRHDLHAFLYNDLRYLIRIGAHQHDIHAEGLPGQRFCFAHLLPHPLTGGACRPNQPQSACLRHTGGQMMLRNPCHTALDDRIFCS